MMATLPTRQSRLPRQSSAATVQGSKRSVSPLPRVKRGNSNRNVSSPTSSQGKNKNNNISPLSSNRSQSASRLPPRANSYGAGVVGGAGAQQPTGRRSASGGGGSRGGLPARINSYGGPTTRDQRKAFGNFSKNGNNGKPKLLVDYSKRRADLRQQQPKFVSKSDRTLDIRRTSSLEEQSLTRNRPLSVISRAQSERGHSSVVDWNKLSNDLEWEGDDAGQQQQKQHKQQGRDRLQYDANKDHEDQHSSCTDFLRQSFLTKPLGMSNSHLLGADFHFQKELQQESEETLPEQQDQQQDTDLNLNASVIVEKPDDDPDLLSGSSHHTITLRSSRRESMNLKKQQGLLGLEQRGRSLSPVRSKSDATGMVGDSSRKLLKKTNSLSPIRRPNTISKRNVSGGPPPFNHLGLQPSSAHGPGGAGQVNNSSFRKKKPNIIQRITSGGPPPLNHMGLSSFRQQQHSQQQQQPQQQQQGLFQRSKTSPIRTRQPKQLQLQPQQQQQQNRPLQRSKTSPIRTRPTRERMTVTGPPPPANFLNQPQPSLGKKSSNSLMDDDSSNHNNNIDNSKGSAGAMEDESMRLGDVFGVDNSNFASGTIPSSSNTRRGPTTTATKAAASQQKWASMGQKSSNVTTAAASATAIQTNPSLDSTDEETEELIKKLTQDSVPPPPVGLRLYKSMSAMTMSAFQPSSSPIIGNRKNLQQQQQQQQQQHQPAPLPSQTTNNSLKSMEQPQPIMEDFSGASQDTHGSLSFRRKSGGGGKKGDKSNKDGVLSMNVIPSASSRSDGGSDKICIGAAGKGTTPPTGNKKKNRHLGGTLGNLQPWDDDFNASLSSMSSHWESMDDDSYQQEQDRRRASDQSADSAASNNNPNNHTTKNRKSSLTLGDEDSEAKDEEEEEDLLFLPAPLTAPPKRAVSGPVVMSSAARKDDLISNKDNNIIPRTSSSSQGSKNGPKREASGRSLKGSRDEDIVVAPSSATPARGGSSRKLRSSDRSSSRKLRASDRSASPPEFIPPPPTSFPRRAVSSGAAFGASSGVNNRSRRRNSNNNNNNNNNNKRNSISGSTTGNRPKHRKSLSDSGAPITMHMSSSSSRMNGSSSRLWNSRRRKSLGDSDSSMHFVLRRNNSRQDKLQASISSVGDSQQNLNQSDSSLLFGPDEDYMDLSEKKRRLRDKLVRSNSSFKSKDQKQNGDETHNRSSSRSNTPSPTNNTGSRRTTAFPANNRKQFQKTLSVTRLESEYDRFQREIVTEHLKKKQAARSVSPIRRNAALLMNKSDSVPKNLGQNRSNSSSNLLSQIKTEKIRKLQQKSASSSAEEEFNPLLKANELLAEVGQKAGSLSQMGTPRRAALPPTTWTRNKSRSNPNMGARGDHLHKQGSSRRGGLEKQESSRRKLEGRGGLSGARSTSPGVGRGARHHPVSKKKLGRSQSLDENEWDEKRAKGFRESMIRQASFLTGSRIRRLNPNPNSSKLHNSMANLNASFSPSHGGQKKDFGGSLSNFNYSVPNFKY